MLFICLSKSFLFYHYFEHCNHVWIDAARSLYRDAYETKIFTRCTLLCTLVTHPCIEYLMTATQNGPKKASVKYEVRVYLNLGVQRNVVTGWLKLNATAYLNNSEICVPLKLERHKLLGQVSRIFLKIRWHCKTL